VLQLSQVLEYRYSKLPLAAIVGAVSVLQEKSVIIYVVVL